MAPPRGQIRPARYLLAFVVILLGIYSLVFFTGDRKPTPELGIDLQGGTRVTLTARTPNGKPPSDESLKQARQIIEQRVNGLGVSGSEVTIDGTNLVITVPGKDGEQAKRLGQTAELNLRQVKQAVPVSATQGVPGQGGQGQGVPGQGVPGQGGQGQGVPGQGVPGQGGQGGASQQGNGAGGSGQDGPANTAPQAAVQQAQDQQQDSGQQGDSGQQQAPGQSGEEATRAERIEQAKQLRQSENPAIQRQALMALDCSAPDPLRGNADPNKPLVTCGQDGNTKYILEPVLIPGTQIADANSAPPGQQKPQWTVNLNFKQQGSQTWADFTSQNVGQQVGFVLDNQVVSAPSINTAIVGGNTQIEGDFTQEEADNLANTLKYGSLPLAFDQSTAETVSPTLGIVSLEAALLAGGIGLILVAAYCLVYYRLLGVLTILSLVLSGAVVYGVLVLFGRWIGFTLDLPGMAGFIIAIGITADSFIVFFERLKDEIREGRTFRSAVPRSWARARRTILSADTVSFLAAGVLYLLAVGQVKGFAFTLGMSTVLDLIVVFLVTHPLVALASRNKFLSRPGLSGLGAVQRMGERARKQRQGNQQQSASGGTPKEA
ncbi:protein translocase subunit SecD [Actinopolyspora saharensis]|uniref:Protein translocase subunit SecD n=1 Tax=Actinopolyspora saharensis TaxID=995062 RepID=A0A1H0Y4E2_9ACTN|nr:protein translocase subunit SecD [Actinopolyspora saharensis]SDQ09826.1 preprotein translocase subunit SecD [Actinopolyspora saharensis]